MIFVAYLLPLLPPRELKNPREHSRSPLQQPWSALSSSSRIPPHPVYLATEGLTIIPVSFHLCIPGVISKDSCETGLRDHVTTGRFCRSAEALLYGELTARHFLCRRACSSAAACGRSGLFTLSGNAPSDGRPSTERPCRS